MLLLLLLLTIMIMIIIIMIGCGSASSPLEGSNQRDELKSFYSLKTHFCHAVFPAQLRFFLL